MQHRQVWCLLAKAAFHGTLSQEYTANLRDVLMRAHRILDNQLQDNTVPSTKDLMRPNGFPDLIRATLNTIFQMSGFVLHGPQTDNIRFRLNPQAALSETGSACLHQICYTLLDVAGRLDVGFELDAKLDKIFF